MFTVFNETIGLLFRYKPE